VEEEIVVGSRQIGRQKHEQTQQVPNQSNAAAILLREKKKKKKKKKITVNNQTARDC
jgi:hypothetical protein